MPRILLLNGPNLGRLGERSPEIYGRMSLADIVCAVEETVGGKGFSLTSFQSESEAELIAVLQESRNSVGAIINPGALMIAGWSLRDALEDWPNPWIEVHISNIWKREAFRHQSILSPLSSGVIAGLGWRGYIHAAKSLLEIAGDSSDQERNATGQSN
jgi:5-deoxy-5-amino-3-dehydroquinate dehydratase